MPIRPPPPVIDGAITAATGRERVEAICDASTVTERTPGRELSQVRHRVARLTVPAGSAPATDPAEDLGKLSAAYGLAPKSRKATVGLGAGSEAKREGTGREFMINRTL